MIYKILFLPAGEYLYNCIYKVEGTTFTEIKKFDRVFSNKRKAKRYIKKKYTFLPFGQCAWHFSDGDDIIIIKEHFEIVRVD